MSRTTTINPVRNAFAVVDAWLDISEESSSEGAPGKGSARELQQPPRTLADEIAARFGLDSFARNVLLTCAYAALEPEAARRFAAINGNSAHAQPNIGNLLALLPGAHWSALTPDAVLRREGLIETSNASAGLAATVVSLADSALFSMLGQPALSSEIASSARRAEPVSELTPARRKLAAAIEARLRAQQGETLQLCGTDPVGKEQAAALACSKVDKRLYVLNALSIPQGAIDVAQLARHWRRDLRLIGAMLYIDASGVTDARPLMLFAELVGLPLLLAAPEVLTLGTLPSLRLEMPRPRATEHEPIWRDALGPLAKRMNGAVERLAGAFALAPEVINSVAADLRATTKHRPKIKPTELEDLAWNACRLYARPRMDDLARRITASATWDDLVVPDAQKDVLRAIAAQVRQRAQVYETWGWAERSGGRGLGVSALFAGPSGSGKTMAGEVLGAELKLDVYRVDLSSIVSKWLGETEKNLRRVFDAADEGSVILQFDEADAIFGKRSEVKDSHDRNANIEVSYLLQRFEEYRGLAILTTNLRGNIDQAFLRRIRFIVDFSFPSPADRVRIWEKVFPRDLPRDDLNLTLLGQLNLTGGSIRNIAITSAFFAADEGCHVGMSHVRRAAKLEYDKVGRVLTDAELRGWPA